MLTGRSFFPNLISGPFHTGLHIAFAFSIACCLIAAVASWSRGSRYIAADEPAAAGLDGRALAEPVDVEPLFGEPGDAGIGAVSDDEDVEDVAGDRGGRPRGGQRRRGSAGPRPGGRRAGGVACRPPGANGGGRARRAGSRTRSDPG